MIEHHVYFAVFGFDEDPAIITRVAGVTPDDIWRQGESYSALTPEARRMENRWILASNLDQQASHREHFEALLIKLEALGDNLTTLRQTYRCGIGVSQYFFMDDPAFYLPGDLMNRYRALSLTLTFDQLGLDASPATSDD
ncbi:DUF4279 domain-containing protein [Alcanivorax sp. JB21]|uniref:DUF4279 domain-containing protein n=1 Tax=Alcanivorax limicola TaxID=2874102 RepID=UPI001CC125CB|nr:DUF4279 domain-containing protein [Alcanivorax limicola]MBZ2189957.1 DUF4279 domain-containing protein [Alcanivorax limicola]